MTFYLLGQLGQSEKVGKSLIIRTLFVPVNILITGTLLGQNWDAYFRYAFRCSGVRLRLPALLETMREGYSLSAPPPALPACGRERGAYCVQTSPRPLPWRRSTSTNGLR